MTVPNQLRSSWNRRPVCYHCVLPAGRERSMPRPRGLSGFGNPAGLWSSRMREFSQYSLSTTCK